MSFTSEYFEEFSDSLGGVEFLPIEYAVQIIHDMRRKNGRLFFLGLGGSAANCSHAVNDFRKLTKIEAHTIIDNASEFSALLNDNGDSYMKDWLENFNLESKDVLFVLSVGGGDYDKNVSVPLIKAIDYARLVGTQVISIVGKPDGYAAKFSDVKILVPCKQEYITPISESMQSVILHLMVTHPLLKERETKW